MISLPLLDFLSQLITTFTFFSNTIYFGGGQTVGFPLCPKNPTNNCMSYCVETPTLSRARPYAAWLYMTGIQTQKDSPEMCISKQESFLLMQKIKGYFLYNGLVARCLCRYKSFIQHHGVKIHRYCQEDASPNLKGFKLHQDCNPFLQLTCTERHQTTGQKEKAYKEVARTNRL